MIILLHKRIYCFYSKFTVLEFHNFSNLTFVTAVIRNSDLQMNFFKVEYSTHPPTNCEWQEKIMQND